MGRWAGIWIGLLLAAAAAPGDENAPTGPDDRPIAEWVERFRRGEPGAIETLAEIGPRCLPRLLQASETTFEIRPVLVRMGAAGTRGLAETFAGHVDGDVRRAALDALRRLDAKPDWDALVARAFEHGGNLAFRLDVLEALAADGVHPRCGVTVYGEAIEMELDWFRQRALEGLLARRDAMALVPRILALHELDGAASDESFGVLASLWHRAPAARAAVVAATKSERSDHRVHAFAAMVRVPSPDAAAVAVCAAGLEDAEDGVRAVALDALIALAAGVPHSFLFTHENPDVRRLACEAAAARAVVTEPLLACLDDTARTVRLAALEAVFHTGDRSPSVQRALSRAARSWPAPDRFRVVRTLLRLDLAAGAALRAAAVGLSDIEPEYAELVLEELAVLGPRARPALPGVETALRPGHGASVRATAAWTRFAITGEIAPSVRELRLQLRTTPPEDCEPACRVLLRCGRAAAPAIGELTALLEHDVPARAAAALALGRCGAHARTAAARLAELAASEAAAAAALADLDALTAEGERVLAQAVDRPCEAAVWAAALRWGVRHDRIDREEAAARIWSRKLRRRDWSDDLALIHVAGDLGDPLALRRLKRIAVHERPELRAAAAHAIWRIESAPR